MIKIIQNVGSNFKINKNIIYFVLFRNIVRGFLVERTPYKATWYMWNWKCPLFRVDSFVSLNYAHRISNAGKKHSGGDYFSGSDDDIAAMALDSLEYVGLPNDIMAGYTAEQFLEEHFADRTMLTSPSQAFDLACAAGLCGEIEFSLTQFDMAATKTYVEAARFGMDEDHHTFLADIDSARCALNGGREAFQAHIDRASLAAAAAHGFCPPTIA